MVVILPAEIQQGLLRGDGVFVDRPVSVIALVGRSGGTGVSQWYGGDKPGQAASTLYELHRARNQVCVCGIGPSS